MPKLRLIALQKNELKNKLRNEHQPEHQPPDSELYTRHGFRSEMGRESNNEFGHITLIKRFEIVPVEYFLRATREDAAIVEQHQHMIAEAACPADIVKHHYKRFILPG